MSVIQKILALMEKENVNARKLTMDLGLSNSCITEWKKGKAKPSIEAVVKIAGYFGVTTDYLLFDCPDPDKRNQEKKLQTVQCDQKQRQTKKNEGEETESGEEGQGSEDLQLGKENSNECLNEAFLETGNVIRRIYREHGRGYQESAGYLAELSGEDRKLLDCYHKLDDEDREYIWCKMIVLEREAMD